MKNKSRRTVPGLLKDFKIIPITDPAEIAAAERRIRAAEKALAARESSAKPKPRKRK
jgi:hypothetical protein